MIDRGSFLGSCSNAKRGLYDRSIAKWCRKEGEGKFFLRLPPFFYLSLALSTLESRVDGKFRWHKICPTVYRLGQWLRAARLPNLWSTSRPMAKLSVSTLHLNRASAWAWGLCALPLPSLLPLLWFRDPIEDLDAAFNFYIDFGKTSIFFNLDIIYEKNREKVTYHLFDGSFPWKSLLPIVTNSCRTEVG